VRLCGSCGIYRDGSRAPAKRGEPGNCPGVVCGGGGGVGGGGENRLGGTQSGVGHWGGKSPVIQKGRFVEAHTERSKSRRGVKPQLGISGGGWRESSRGSGPLTVSMGKKIEGRAKQKKGIKNNKFCNCGHFDFVVLR